MAPNLVGRRGVAQRRAGGGVAASPPSVGEAVAFEDGADSGWRRPSLLGALALEKGMQLAFAPARPLRPQRQDGSLVVGADGVRMAARRARAVGQPGHPLLFVARPSLVAGLAADAVDAAEIGDRFVAGFDFPHEIHSFVVHMSLLPSQNRITSFCSGFWNNLLPMCSGRSVTYVLGTFECTSAAQAVGRCAKRFPAPAGAFEPFSYRCLPAGGKRDTAGF